MRRALRFLAMTIGAIVASGLGAGPGAQVPAVLGVVLEIVPPVYLRPTPNGAEVALDPARDVGRALVEGQALRAAPPGRVKFTAAGRLETLASARGRFEIRSPVLAAAPVSPAQLDAQNRMNKALQAYGRPGGSRGLGSRLYSPADQSTIRLEALTVRWARGEAHGPLALELRTTTGRGVWSIGALPPASERLPPDATEALKNALRPLDAAAAPLWTLVLRDESGVVATVTFRLLAAPQARELSARLSEHDGEPDPLLRSIGRAFELANLSLYNEAADEFDRLLLAAPRSEAVLRAALSAHDRTGNLQRVRELTALLR